MLAASCTPSAPRLSLRASSVTSHTLGGVAWHASAGPDWTRAAGSSLWSAKQSGVAIAAADSRHTLPSRESHEASCRSSLLYDGTGASVLESSTRSTASELLAPRPRTSRRNDEGRGAHVTLRPIPETTHGPVWS
eukprot:7389358-Prymnesium_polylepis.1